MVIQDLSAENSNTKDNFKQATALDRFLAGVFDVLLLLPIATLVPALHIRDARLDYLQGFDSNVWVQIVVLFFLTAIMLQTVFLYFIQATPGAAIMHLRVRSTTGRLSWNQCLLRATFYLLSWMLVIGLPLLEVLTHPLKRAWHDRVSDTVVIDLKRKPFLYRTFAFNVNLVRFMMIAGICAVFFSAFSIFVNKDDLTYIAGATVMEDTDEVIAQALLRKDESTDMQNEVEEKIWSSRKLREKALAYFFKLQIEKNDDVKKSAS